MWPDMLSDLLIHRETAEEAPLFMVSRLLTWMYIIPLVSYVQNPESPMVLVSFGIVAVGTLVMVSASRAQRKFSRWAMERSERAVQYWQAGDIRRAVELLLDVNHRVARSVMAGIRDGKQEFAFARENGDLIIYRRTGTQTIHGQPPPSGNHWIDRILMGVNTVLVAVPLVLTINDRGSQPVKVAVLVAVIGLVVLCLFRVVRHLQAE